MTKKWEHKDGAIYDIYEGECGCRQVFRHFHTFQNPDDKKGLVTCPIEECQGWRGDNMGATEVENHDCPTHAP